MQILVRDIPPDEYNPLTTEQTIEILRVVYADEDVVVWPIANVSSLDYGRGVGYDVIEHTPPAEIGGISATATRDKIQAGDPSWKQSVMPGAWDLVERYLG